MSEAQILRVKQLRLDIKDVLRNLQDLTDIESGGGRERSLCRTKLQEASMWLGMDLRRLADGETCYPKADDLSTAEVDPADDGAPIVKG